jgi:hypothetical protein
LLVLKSDRATRKEGAMTAEIVLVLVLAGAAWVAAVRSF